MLVIAYRRWQPPDKTLDRASEKRSWVQGAFRVTEENRASPNATAYEL